jgi:hypothetical protein
LVTGELLLMMHDIQACDLIYLTSSYYTLGENLYRTTGKGTKFMRVYSNIDELAGPLREQRI